jgi:hypothetical protein
MNTCLMCEKETSNPKFCSRSCAASYNNKKVPKRKPEHKCIDCGKPINANKSRCKEHYLIWVKTREVKDMTLSEAIYQKHHRSSAYALVRTRARAAAKKYNMNVCENCGYDKHVEIAHKQGISTFTGDTLISIINARENLMALCPNCHWEYDHNMTRICL